MREDSKKMAVYEPGMGHSLHIESTGILIMDLASRTERPWCHPVYGSLVEQPAQTKTLFTWGKKNIYSQEKKIIRESIPIKQGQNKIVNLLDDKELIQNIYIIKEGLRYI